MVTIDSRLRQQRSTGTAELQLIGPNSKRINDGAGLAEVKGKMHLSGQPRHSGKRPELINRCCKADRQTMMMMMMVMVVMRSRWEM